MTQPASLAKHSPARRRMGAGGEDWLLVCLQDPFDAVGDSSVMVHSWVAAVDRDPSHQWRLEAVLELNAPRVFTGWATHSDFTLDLSVQATAAPAAGTWGGTVRTASGSGKCRVIVTRDPSNKVRFSLATGARHAAEQAMCPPDSGRFLNADVAFELNGPCGLNAAAVAVISNRCWSRLIAGSSAATVGLAFDGKWRTKLDDSDGDSCALGAWSFGVMTRTDYDAWCLAHGKAAYILGAG